MKERYRLPPIAVSQYPEPNRQSRAFRRDLAVRVSLGERAGSIHAVLRSLVSRSMSFSSRAYHGDTTPAAKFQPTSVLWV